MKSIPKNVKHYSRISGLVGFEHLDIFGIYYILDTSKTAQKYSVLPAEIAALVLRIKRSDSFRHMHIEFLVNVSRDFNVVFTKVFAFYYDKNLTILCFLKELSVL